MKMNPEELTPAPSSTECVNCGSEEGRLLHHVRHRGHFRRLCTSCVLRLHPQSFCPSCFSVYPDPSNPPDNTIPCSKCYSSTHPDCLIGPATSSPYICPLCRQPSSPIFNPVKTQIGIGEKTDTQMGNVRKIDKEAAKVLLAAAKIAALSMGKAAVAAKEEAMTKAMEAAVARKKAKDALEHVAFLVAREKPKSKEGDGPSEVSAKLNEVELKEKEKEKEKEVVVQVVSPSNGLQQEKGDGGVGGSGEGIIDPQQGV